MGAGGHSSSTLDEIREARGERFVDLVFQRKPRHWDSSRDCVRSGVFDGYQRDLFVFDPTTQMWALAAESKNQPLAAAKCWAVALKGRLWVDGGYGFINNSITQSGSARNDMQQFSRAFNLKLHDFCSNPSRVSNPECIVAISKLSLSLCSRGLHDGASHVGLGKGRYVWATAPPEDVPDFDIVHGGEQPRTFLIIVSGSPNLTNRGRVITDVSRGQLSARGLEVLESRKIVDWYSAKNSLGLRRCAAKEAGMTRLQLGR